MFIRDIRSLLLAAANGALPAGSHASRRETRAPAGTTDPDNVHFQDALVVAADASSTHG
jgi:hypothetical protein